MGLIPNSIRPFILENQMQSRNSDATLAKDANGLDLGRSRSLIRYLLYAAVLLAISYGLSSQDTSRLEKVQGQGSSDLEAIEIDTELIAEGFSRPVEIANAGDGSGRVFVVEKAGRIQVVEDGERLGEPFLDIRSLVQDSSNEQGLLGLAFHPDYAQNGEFYVNYTARRSISCAIPMRGNAETVVARYKVSQEDPNKADPGSASDVLRFCQPYNNHNGGDLAFGPDGQLYVATGDGGFSGDPLGAGQDLEHLLGKILRLDIDVDPEQGYQVPEDNPFVGIARIRPEVWAWGLRNPWRISFDRETGDFYIGDVGQNQYEEIDFQPADSEGGENYGWNEMEGMHCYRSGCDREGKVLPIFEYRHNEGLSVSGGEVYRGSRYPDLEGVYFLGDYGKPGASGDTGPIWGLKRDEQGVWQSRKLGFLGVGLTSFGLDDEGEIYMVFDSAASRDKGGQLHRLISTRSAPTSLVAEGAELEQVSDGHRFTEGPAATKDGDVYFTDVRENKIHHIALDGSVDLYRDDLTAPNGLYFDAEGGLVICEMGQRRIVRDDLAGTTETLADRWQGKRLNRTNDLYIHPSGGIYFSDPIYGSPPDPQEIPSEQVYYLPSDDGPVQQVTNDLVRPNGLIGSPDGSKLFIADQGANRTYAYDIEPGGALGNKTLFVERGADGVTLDELGNLYLTNQGRVWIYDASGEEVMNIEIPQSPTNVTFGGADFKTLYITAQSGVYTLRMNVGPASRPGDVGPTIPTATPSETSEPAPDTPSPVPSQEPAETDIPSGNTLYLPALERD